jgi:potassium efflux system protein
MRLGDIVQIANTRGEVTHIGLRSSILRQSDGIEILVPNSTFLESSVTNLTYSSKSLQSTLSIEVVYGSSIGKVTHLLLQVAGAHGLVLKKPAPTVTLSDFTGKGFAFTLSYWINLGEANAAEVASDLRRMIVHQLAESGIALSNMPTELLAHTQAPLNAQSDIPPPEQR